MSRRHTLSSLLIGSAAIVSLATLSACDDYSTGQDAEPPGALKVERLTLSDGHQFIDTSAPLDCEDAKLKDTPECVNSPFKDAFSMQKHPPTVDHATKLRVVFNKLPLKLNGVDVEKAPSDGKLPTELCELDLRDRDVIKLECDGCAGIPTSYTSLQLAGSALTPDPTTFDYGPALQLEVLTSIDPDGPLACLRDDASNTRDIKKITDDPLRALEPNTTYRVVINPGLSGRNAADKVLLDERAKSLLTFKTQPFAVANTQLTDVMKGEMAIGLGNSSAVVVTTNAGVDHSRFQAGTITTAEITVNGGAAMSVPVVLRNGVKAACERGNQRSLYVAPVSGTWVNAVGASDDVKLKIVIRGSDIRDIAQDAAHTPGMGRSSLSEDITINATVVADPPAMPGMDDPHLVGTSVSAADVNACAS